MLATCAISFLSFTSLAILLSSSTTAAATLSIPLFTSIGFAPAVMFLRPSLKIEWARTVAVVVPSPASSAVFDATSFTSCAPMFSIGLSSSISLATETPSFVIDGAPKLFCISTFRPRGPIVTLTASLNFFTPSYSAFLELSEKWISFAIFFPFNYYLIFFFMMNKVHHKFISTKATTLSRVFYLFLKVVL